MSDYETLARSERLKRALDLWSAHHDLLAERPDAVRRAQFASALPERELLSRAEEFHDAVAPYRRQFVEAGARPDFLETLQKNIAQLRQAVTTCDS
jgi:hypothetical protein